MIFGQVVSQWAYSEIIQDNAPNVFNFYGNQVIITDATGEPTETVLNDPNFVINDVWATLETWQDMDTDPQIQVLYYG